jgi:hypothetical protein
MLASGLGSRAKRYASSNLPSAIKPTYLPALVCAGQAIMHGKFVWSQSSSIFLFRIRFSISRSSSPQEWKWIEAETAQRFPPRSRHFDSVKSAVALPDTLTGFDWFFAPSCQAVTV